MTCPKCGAQLLEGSTFCGACGQRLTPVATQPVAPGGIKIDEDSRGRGRGYAHRVTDVMRGWLITPQKSRSAGNTLMPAPPGE